MAQYVVYTKSHPCFMTSQHSIHDIKSTLSHITPIISDSTSTVYLSSHQDYRSYSPHCMYDITATICMTSYELQMTYHPHFMSVSVWSHPLYWWYNTHSILTSHLLYIWHHMHCIWHLTHDLWHHNTLLMPSKLLYLTSHQLYLTAHPRYLCHHTQIIEHTTPIVCMITQPQYVWHHMNYLWHHIHCLWYHTTLWHHTHYIHVIKPRIHVTASTVAGPLLIVYWLYHTYYMCDMKCTICMTSQEFYMTSHSLFMT